MTCIAEIKRISHFHFGNRLMLRLTSFLMVLAASASALTAQSQVAFGINAFRLNRPANLPLFQKEDFKIDHSKIAENCETFLYGNGEALKALADYLVGDTEGQKLWLNESENAANVLNTWDFQRSNLDLGFISCFGTDRYIYCVTQLESLSFIYILTRHQTLGRFIKEHILQIAKLPVDFWCHSELRKYASEVPLGMIETADICSSVALSLSATSGLFTPDELEMVKSSLKAKGLQPCINWLAHPRMNNFAAIIGSGAYVAAKYLDDQDALKKATDIIEAFIRGSIEDDGSYGEGLSYFEYPVRSMLPAILAMAGTEREEIFSGSGMVHSSGWLLYPYLSFRDDSLDSYGTVLHFGDNGYAVPHKQSMNYILALLFKDPLATWLIQKQQGRPGFSEKLLELTLKGGLPAPKSPVEAGLPLLRSFNSGHSYIRSTWDEKGIILGFWSGDGSRVKYSHQRPELNSIALGAYGEYLIVSPASASYRSPLRSLYDQATRSANTITVDDQNQLFRPAAIVASEAGEWADLIVSEAAPAYGVAMKSVRRSILFIREPGYFVITDNVESIDNQHKYTWRLHLNNKDDRGVLNELSKNHWLFSRPRASLDIRLFTEQSLETNIGQGYLHGPGRDYSPGGIFEGRLGSSIELEASNRVKSKTITFHTVLFPTQNTAFLPEIKYEGNKVTVGNDTLTFADNCCLIERNGESERFRLY